ncbi:OmpA/MotB family protein [Siphonobacter aquaeclarae]|jgi:outer membrane protein OmpA-like peptidoglycan-associated protein|uniref:Outer membrane protein OmpA n=1 Tax=Siphonobacter aquaeclarae TaxID=563176 RepID=A0A1G9W300_9BACT|nr:hypothetical protein [Siphonobacter aquaeclarae]MBO9638388.1 hypothetical protein [Siphonobacter aquaeclarae]SDM78899.1 Outer membrane protein OmpA [Siphonobacter aquaeclarae]
MKTKDSGFFWPSYTDLMTSLFFIMLVLYVLTVAILKSKEAGYINDALKYQKIQTIERALQELNGTYFRYDENNKRFRLGVDVNFRPNKADISELDSRTQDDLLEAGRILFRKIQKVTKENPDVSYMVVVEGNAQRANDNWQSAFGRQNGYELSYRRALALTDFWKRNGLDFDRFPNCEILIVGSGHFGKSRDPRNEIANRRFTIQITSKVGKTL